MSTATDAIDGDLAVHPGAEQLDWAEANRAFMVAVIAALRASLERDDDERHDADEGDAVAAARALVPGGPALDALAAAFGLSPFERDIVALCAGVELDSGLRAACAARQGGQDAPTFSLAMSCLAGAHWSALAPGSPLRRWRFVEPGGDSLTTAPLRLDERVLHYLAGVDDVDRRLAGLVTPIRGASGATRSQCELAQHCAELWATRPDLVLALDGARERVRRVVALAALRVGAQAVTIPAAELPAQPAERETLARILEREAVLSSLLVLVDAGDVTDPGVRASVEALLEDLTGSVAVLTSEPLQTGDRACLRLDVRRPATAELVDVWRAAVGPLAAELEDDLPRLAANFDLDPPAIAAIAGAVGDREPRAAVWDACRIATRRRLDGLAHRVEARAGWEQLVLPDAARRALHELVLHVAHGSLVLEEWGFAARGARGLGAAALFCGPSGTGKTMAAEVLAAELRLDLYRVDLSAVVSKYIGETERNLRRLFDAAELSGAILLFDEADALFGKRSEVRDSHDRYANIEVSYLLQRMEDHNGLAILTTNDRSALDGAFLRRLRFVVEFPFPGQAARAQVWRRVFPPRVPTRGLDHDRLSRLNVAGGSIRNVALAAAFLAAAESEPVGMPHCALAARTECRKLGRPATSAEIGDWT